MKRYFAVLLLILCVTAGTALGEPKDWPAAWSDDFELKINYGGTSKVVGGHPFRTDANRGHATLNGINAYAVDFLPLDEDENKEIAILSPVDGTIICCNFEGWPDELLSPAYWSTDSCKRGHGGDFDSAFGYHIMIRPDEDDRSETGKYGRFQHTDKNGVRGNTGELLYTKNTFLVAHIQKDKQPEITDFECVDPDKYIYKVKKGQCIGYMGNTGGGGPSVNPKHLHIELINRLCAAVDRADCLDVQLFGLKEEDFPSSNADTKKLRGGFGEKIETEKIEGTYSTTSGTCDHKVGGIGDAYTGYTLSITGVNEAPGKEALSLNGQMSFSNNTSLNFGGKDITYTKGIDSNGRKTWSGMYPHFIDTVGRTNPLLLMGEVILALNENGELELKLTEKRYKSYEILGTITLKFSKESSSSSVSASDANKNKISRSGFFTNDH